MESGSEKLRPLLLRCINQKQILILSEISGKSGETATTLLIRLSRERSLPLSTLKLNLRKLTSLGLILQNNSKPVTLSDSGSLVLKIAQSSLTDKTAVCKTVNPGSNPGSGIHRRRAK